MKFTLLADWLAWLELQHPKEIDLGLERIRCVAERLNLDFSASTVVSVAGTNGKGSFVAAAQALLRANGLNVGAYTSPHFLRFNERIEINGCFVEDSTLIEAFESVYQALGSVSLSYFEFTTLAALSIFQQRAVDYIILEVGLGGRLDAVNIVDADIAVITSIGLDHQDYLGDNLNSIAIEKAGIFRAEKPVICAEINPPQSLVDLLQRQPHVQIGEAFSITERAADWTLHSQINNCEMPSIAFNGLSQPSQAAAIMLVNGLLDLAMSAADVSSCLNQLSLPGRFQTFEDDGVTIVLDVAHNIQSVSLLKRRLEAMKKPENAKCVAVFNMMADLMCHMFFFLIYFVG